MSSLLAAELPSKTTRGRKPRPTSPATARTPSSPAKLRAVREAVEVYERVRAVAAIENESDARYDDFYPARNALIAAIRSLRPGESIPRDGINLDPIHFQSVTVDGIVYAVSYDHRMDEWVVQGVPTFLAPVEA
jgi:hypothetical protein